MKLRFSGNSLRLRVNQKEVGSLAAGVGLKRRIEFPGNTFLVYNLHPAVASEPQVFYAQGCIDVSVPQAMVSHWAETEEVGLYFTLITGAEPLRVMIEKDMECLDGAPEEYDPDAFPRSPLKQC